MWRVSSRSGVATLRTAIHLLLTYSRCAVEWIASTWRMRDVRILVCHVCCFFALGPLTAICLWLCTYISGAAVHNSNSPPPVAGPADFNAAAVTTVGLILLLVLLIVFGFLSWCGVHTLRVIISYRSTSSYHIISGPILSVLPALIVHSELKSVHPGFPVAFIF